MNLLSRMAHAVGISVAAIAWATAAQSATPMVAARMGQAVVLKSNGSLAAWGSNSDGQLGNGRPLLAPTPGQLTQLPDIVQVATSNEHVVALDSNGRVWTWGATNSGRLGSRAQRNPALPGRVRGIQGAIAVAASDYASFALKADGTVWFWGSALGGWTANSAEPRRLTELSDIVQIAAGNDHLVMRTRGGAVVTFGRNDHGQAGDATSGSEHGPRAPVVVGGLANVTWVAAGQSSSFAVTAAGELYGWGQVHWVAPDFKTPSLMPGFSRPVSRVSVRNNAFALLDDGTVWLVGRTNDGIAYSAIPRQVQGLVNIVEIAVPGVFDVSVVARDSAGSLFVSSQNIYGEFGTGIAGEVARAVTRVPLASPVRTMSVGNYGIVAVTTDAKTWTWGRDGLGALGLGALNVSPVPVAVRGLANATRVAVAENSMAALDESGNVWAWGRNDPDIRYGGDGRTPVSVPSRVAISSVKEIAAGYNFFVYLKTDGTVWSTGQGSPAPVPGVSSVASIAAGPGQHFYVTTSGELWSLGDNASGQLGDGTFTRRVTPTRITGVPALMQVSADGNHAIAVSTAGEVWAWGSNNHGILGNGQTGGVSATPQKVPGLSGVVEVSVGYFHALARRSDGTVWSWGAPWVSAALGRSGNALIPAPVEGLDQVTSMAAGAGASYAMRADGSVWGWGGIVCPFQVCPTPGDGTLVQRDRPVVVLRENGAGDLDSNDWFLDARPGTPKNIPPAGIPKLISVTQSLSSSGLLNVDASVNVRLSDQSRTLGLYVVGLVPPAFLDQVTTAPGAMANRAEMKADQQVLVNLTPAGWTVASGQLQAYNSGVTNGALAARNLLVNVNPSNISGARFCIGYGESAVDMLKAETIRDFLSLDGVASSALGLPCLLSGVYVSGPHSSPQGSPVPLRAVVVGQAPTGTVRFRERFTDVSSDIPIAPVNPAVSEARVSYTPPAAGEYAFGAIYPGNAQNAAAASEVPLRNVVSPVSATSTTRVSGPVSSEIGMEVRLVAWVAGNSPGGTVQFKRGGANEAAPVPVIDDQAVLSVVGLGVGGHSFTAAFSGDGSNPPSESAAFVHRVLDVATSEATLASSANPTADGRVTLTMRVTGANPTGTATLREGPSVIAAQTLANGSASFALTGLAAGIRVFAADYSGDANNPVTTSNAVFQQVKVSGNAGGPTPLPSNYTALWWNAAESGWGLNVNHQGSIVFATLFTYEATGAQMWLVMSGGALQADGVTYSGTLYRTTGPAFNAQPFTPITAANLSAVGTMSIRFSGANAATLTYTVNGVAVTKSIQRQVYGTRAATCEPTTSSRSAMANYQDLWWNANESGWGLNITHQDDALFATLFTYDAAGRGLWLVMSGGLRQSDGSYLGDLYRTTGPAFNAVPFTPITAANLTNVGTMRLSFADGERATLTYSMSGAQVTKAITRQLFSSPLPACRS